MQIKSSYPALFSAGFHDLTDLEIEQYCVSPFSGSNRRQLLYCNFIQLLNQYREFNKQYECFSEVWVDGSFTTEKINPDDIDILVVVDYKVVNSIPVMLQGTVSSLIDRIYIKQNLNIDVLTLWQNNPDQSYDSQRSYWRGWFGYDRNENPKGLVRVSL